jgi:hypothetical protein
MGSLERRADQCRQSADGVTRSSRPDDRYGPKRGPRTGGSNEPLFGAVPARRSHGSPVGAPDAAASAPPPPGGDPVVPGLAFTRETHPARRTDLTALLGRTVLEARVQQICQEYGLIPRSGAAVGSGLSRSYLARAAGVEIAADTHGVITTVFLHFHGDDGFASYSGEIPGGAGSVPRRAHLWAMLGHPDEQGAPYRDRFLGDYGPWDRWVLAGFVLHAQFAADAECLERVTLTLPDRLPRAA